jgi:tetratricopeptide (TPR) repeat protein
VGLRPGLDDVLQGVGMVKTDQVFVSRTSDMSGFPQGRSFVQAVLDAVGRAGCAAVDMSYFAAREGRPADYCRQRVRECEVYVAVVGFRYGSLVPDECVSYTELEFAEATAAGLPRLVFLLDDAVGTDLPDGMVDLERTQVEAFRDRLRGAGLIVSTFASAEGLELAVFQALTQLPRGGTRAVPHQLPAAVAHFAGRAAELNTLTELLTDLAGAGAEGGTGTVVISAIGGTAGVGKTALAVHWAHQVADRFPDGQLYVNLRGFDPGGQVVDPADAIRRFLEALEVPPGRIPVDLDAQAALYRSLLADRRMLIVLDNARDTAQARPLLPGAPGSMVLITSRNALAGLVAAEDARPIALDLLAETEARQLLARRLGTDRVAAEPQAVKAITAACARLPLALAIVAARAAAHPGFQLADLADELRSSHARLDALAADDPASDVRAVFSWSYRGLTPDAARLFRLLGLHPGPDVSAAAAASLAGLPPRAVRPLLAELAHANLLLEHAPRRYTFHDLLRAYATENTRAEDAEEDRRAATHRMFDHYLHTAYPAARTLHPSGEEISLGSAQAGVTPEHLEDAGQALAWFGVEHPILLTAVEMAAGDGFDVHAWQLAWTLGDFLDWRGRWRDWENMQRVALAAARRLGDPSAQAVTHRLLGQAYTRLGRFEDADSELRQAVDLYRQAGDRVGEALTFYGFAWLRERQSCYAEALEYCRQTLAVFRAAGHRRGEARALNGIGWFQALLGENEQAITTCREALMLHQQLGHRVGEASTWDSLGYAYRQLGQHTEAIACYRRAVEVVDGVGDRHGEADFLTHLGDTHYATGDRRGAHDAWQQALEILEDLQAPDADQLRIKLDRLARSR